MEKTWPRSSQHVQVEPWRKQFRQKLRVFEPLLKRLLRCVSALRSSAVDVIYPTATQRVRAPLMMKVQSEREKKRRRKSESGADNYDDDDDDDGDSSEGAGTGEGRAAIQIQALHRARVNSFRRWITKGIDFSQICSDA